MSRNTGWAVAAAGVAGVASYAFLARDAAAPTRATVAPAAAAPRAARQTTAPTAASEVPATRPTEQHAADLILDPANPFELIRSLARRAYEGDGKAQYRIARELDRCEVTLSLVRAERDPETAIWSFGPHWTQPMKEWAIGEYRRCKRLLTEDPFAGLPKPERAYDYQYWTQRALEAGYPMAVTHEALGNLGRLRAGAATARPLDRGTEIEQLTTAALSNEPDALLQMGFNLWQLEDPQRRTRGAALMLAACRAGASCGFGSDVFPFEACYYSGLQECGPGATVENLLSRAARAEDFARAYADSQQIEDALRHGDRDGFKRWLDMF
jgi:hypothetical protein